MPIVHHPKRDEDEPDLKIKDLFADNPFMPDPDLLTTQNITLEELEKCAEATKNWTQGDKEAFEKAAETILRMSEYGYHLWEPEVPSTELHWYNSNASWMVGGSRVEPGEYQLDADAVIVPASPERMKKVLPCLPKLPLYALSYEAKRGMTEEEISKQTLTWAFKQAEEGKRKELQ